MNTPTLTLVKNIIKKLSKINMIKKISKINIIKILDGGPADPCEYDASKVVFQNEGVG